MTWFDGNIFVSLSTVWGYWLDAWLYFSCVASDLGAFLTKQWHSTHQRTSSLNITRSLSSSSLARTTGWVKEACWEPAGKGGWAYVSVALYCKDCIHKTLFAMSIHSDGVLLYLLKWACFFCFLASVPPLPGVSMWGTRLPLCSELPKTRPTGSSD